MDGFSTFTLFAGLPTSSVLLIFAGVFFGSFVAGFAGFGLSAAAGAFLFHIMDPVQAVPLMMFCSIFAQCAGLIHLRKAISVKSAMPFVLGGMIGTPIALIILKGTDSSTLRTAFGAFLILYVGWSFALRFFLLRRSTRTPFVVAGDVCQLTASSVRTTTQEKSFVGFAAGLVGGFTAMPGALVAVWADINQVDKSAQRGFVQPFILMMQIFALLMITATPGFLSPDILLHLTLAAVPLLLGTFLGLYLYGRANAQIFRLATLLIVLTSGIGLVVRL